MPPVREFKQAWKAAGVTLAPSHPALKDCINARVFAEALRHCDAAAAIRRAAALSDKQGNPGTPQ
ncbi:MAG: hypothetical protein WAW46_15070 [Polaromonas sp.]